MAANWKKKKVEIYPGPTSMVVIWIKKNTKDIKRIQSRTNLNGGELERIKVKQRKKLILSNPGPTSMAAIWKRKLKEKVMK